MKPHFIATAGKQPVPPEWAKRFELLSRFDTKSIGGRCAPSHISVISQYSFMQHGEWYDIIAVRWLP